MSKYAFKWGLIGGSMIAFWNILDYFLLYQTFLSKLTFLMNVVLLFLTLYFGIKEIKINYYHKQITFANAGLAGIVITIFLAFTLSGITFVYRNIENSGYENHVIQQTEKAIVNLKKLKELKQTIKEVKASFDPWRQAQSSFFITLIFGIVLSFILAIVLKSKTINIESFN